MLTGAAVALALGLSSCQGMRLSAPGGQDGQVTALERDDDGFVGLGLLGPSSSDTSPGTASEWGGPTAPTPTDPTPRDEDLESGFPTDVEPGIPTDVESPSVDDVDPDDRPSTRPSDPIEPAFPVDDEDLGEGVASADPDLDPSAGELEGHPDPLHDVAAMEEAGEPTAGEPTAGELAADGGPEGGGTAEDVAVERAGVRPPAFEDRQPQPETPALRRGPEPLAWLDRVLRVDRWAPHFAAHNARGTFVLHHENAGTTLVHDLDAANLRRIPASTFKIPNALIALDTGVTTTEEVFPWDGQVREGPQSWNGPQTLPLALRRSTVWVFQELARRAGEDAIRQRLQGWFYGNANTSGGVDRFWLDGGLRITPMEQIDFLRRLARDELDVDPAARQAVVDMLLVDEGPLHKVRAKTGWAKGERGGDLGWVVGWVERSDGRHFFAFNVQSAGGIFDLETARLEILREVMHQEALVFKRAD